MTTSRKRMFRVSSLLIAFLVAFVATRLLFQATGFTPVEALAPPLGHIVDLVIWIAIFLGVAWGIDRVRNRHEQRTGQ
jgi:hypothetical protein